MRDNPKGGELNPIVDDHNRCCKKNSLSVLFCVDKRTKEGFDENGKVHHGRGGEGTDPLKRPKETGRIFLSAYCVI